LIRTMKVAIVCDWLSGIGGAERVVLELHKLYPEAPIYTSQYEPKNIDWFTNADVRTGWLQKLPGSLKKFLPPLRAWYFSHLNLSEYDLVISSSGAEAKGVKTGPNTRHICYMHAPTHYYWARYDEYIKNPGFGYLDPLARLGLKLLVGPMRRWDRKAAQRPDYIIANSSFTKSQIQKYYGRDSDVIHPAVDIDRFKIRNPVKKILNKLSISRSGFLAAGRQTPYKRIDLAIEACTRLDLPLTVVGSGPDHQKLVKLAGPSINFVAGASDKEVVKYFQSAEAFIFPGIDDFGIVAVEALAAGTPVIAYDQGGALDYVTPQNGILFQEQTVESLLGALQKFNPDNFNNASIQKSAVKFSTQAFEKNVKKFLNDKLKNQTVS
jgi:glycosyltransferase involved in cell wall biosynthesis